MFGADTPLVLDALSMVAVLAGVAAGLTFLLVRRRQPSAPSPRPSRTDLEERVEVLERIATDRSSDLAEEIDALRGSEARTGSARS